MATGLTAISCYDWNNPANITLSCNNAQTNSRSAIIIKDLKHGITRTTADTLFCFNPYSHLSIDCFLKYQESETTAILRCNNHPSCTPTFPFLSFIDTACDFIGWKYVYIEYDCVACELIIISLDLLFYFNNLLKLESSYLYMDSINF